MDLDTVLLCVVIVLIIYLTLPTREYASSSTLSSSDSDPQCKEHETVSTIWGKRNGGNHK